MVSERRIKPECGPTGRPYEVALDDFSLLARGVVRKAPLEHEPRIGCHSDNTSRDSRKKAGEESRRAVKRSSGGEQPGRPIPSLEPSVAFEHSKLIVNCPESPSSRHN